MSMIPSDLRYTDSHEWVRQEPGGTAFVGITDFAQKSLGDVVYIDLPKVGTVFDAEEAVGVVESVKAATDLYAPVGGEVLAVNQEVGDSPELVNEDCYDSWIFRVRMSDARQFDKLMDATAYKELIGE
ncbi:glycine cleavage system protein GcvH [Streptomyces sp. NPDC051784]|uniref:glycine cleavage system protein GcvH n=1 Tax=Streptomyces sp. NPDC051784 TaxID=3155805 RepID=UPI00343107A6